MTTTKYSISILVFVFCSQSCLTGHAQTNAPADLESVRSKVIESLERVTAFPAVKLSGRYLAGKEQLYRVTVHARGKTVWMERTRVLEGQKLEHQQKIQQVMQCDLPFIIAFDGKKSYSFDPIQLILDIKDSPKAQGITAKEILPESWVEIYGGDRFSAAIARNTSKHSMEFVSDGVCNWRSDVIMSMFSSDQNVGFPFKEFWFDPKVDFLPTSYAQRNPKMNTSLSGKIDWAKSESHWYPKHATFNRAHRAGELNAEFWIDEVSFDAKSCRLRFDDMESIVPFATRIMVYDANRKLLKSSYKGGAEGEVENKLRNVARQKIQNEFQDDN